MDWTGISQIYYNPAQEDPSNTFLAEAASTLRDYLQQMSGLTFSVVTTLPPAPAIYFDVDPVLLAANNDEAFQIVIDSAAGISITGKTAYAVRNGVFDLLETLGVRWFYGNEDWTIVPDILEPLADGTVTKQPDYIWRLFWAGGGANVDANNWLKRNRLYGQKWYRTGENYRYIYPASHYTANPDGFTHDPTLGSWQLNGYNSDVIAAAVSYVRNLVAMGPVMPSDLAMGGPWPGGRLEFGAIPITPNDGQLSSWQPMFTTDQEASDSNYNLMNEVLKDLATDYPDVHLTCYSYTATDVPPSIALDHPDKMIVFQVQDYGGSAMRDGLSAAGLKLGIYRYFNWLWSHDLPDYHRGVIQLLKDRYAQYGAQFFLMEGQPCFGCEGLTQWIMSKVFWDTNLDETALAEDFYKNAFGVASPTMAEYFNSWTTADYYTLFNYLSRAMALAAEDEPVLERIRQQMYFTYFYWKYNLIGLANLSQTELERLYWLLSKIQNLNLVTILSDRPAVASSLKSRFPDAYPDDAAVSALADPTHTKPTPEEADALFAEAANRPTPDDNFDDNELDLARWSKIHQLYSSGAEVNGRYEMYGALGANIAEGIVTASAYDLTRANISADISDFYNYRSYLLISPVKVTGSWVGNVQPQNGANDYIAIYKYLGYDGGHQVKHTIVESKVGGVVTQLANVPWAGDVSNLKISIENGVVSFYENDTLLYQGPYTLSTYQCYVHLYTQCRSGVYGSSTEPDYVDNFILKNGTPFFTLNIWVNGNGTTDPEPGSHALPPGTEELIQAIPDPGWYLDHWAGAYNGTDDRFNLTVDSDMDLVATFLPIDQPPPTVYYTVTVTAEPGGTTSPVPQQYTLAEGEKITVEAIPDEGYEFLHWEGDIINEEKLIEIQPTADMTVTAVFQQKAPTPPPTGSAKYVVSAVAILGVITAVLKGVRH